MPQNEFIFKHFIVKQDKTSMKVGTDAMLLGAWTAESAKSERAESDEREKSYRAESNESAECDRAKSEGKTDKIEIGNILDIGTGTGVLALMLAQSIKADIDAIDIEGDSFIQAKENFENSAWKNRIKVFHTSLQDYQTDSVKKYDLIISNPPYFEHNIKAIKESTKYRERSHARSVDTLSFENLLIHSKRLLKDDGSLYMIVPSESTPDFLSLAEIKGIYLFDRLDIKSKQDQLPVRCILGFSKSKKDFKTSELVIYNQDKTYTEDYIRLTENYYAKNMSRPR